VGEAFLDDPTSVRLEAHAVEIPFQVVDETTFDLGVRVVKEFLEDVVPKDVVLEEGEVRVDFLREEGGDGGCFQLVLDEAGSTLVAAEFNDVVAQVAQGPFVGFVGMEFVQEGGGGALEAVLVALWIFVMHRYRWRRRTIIIPLAQRH